MHITILRRTNSGLRNFNLSTPFLAAFILINLVAVPAVCLWGGYQFALNETADYEQIKLNNTILIADYNAEKRAFEDYKRRSESHLDGLAARLGLLQAEINRINAVGSRILELNGLDAEEFDFSSPPSLGGPFLHQDAHKTNASREVKASVFDNIEGMHSVLESNLQQFELIENLLINSELGAEKYISGRPITKGWLSSGYGKRIDPFNGKPAWHEGVDFAGKEGADVVATASGVVTFAGDRYGYGLLVEISHGEGMSTRYGHNKSMVVAKGDIVTKGQVIAKMGNTGRSTGPHVHYEVLRKGKPVNPLNYVYRKAKKSVKKARGGKG